ncbi:hypothetical protein DMUE_2985 [Dictyocoela muelleri]|nr:hypothetical protein DMUE_2985 [Dictyocoela muelleri]
MKIFYLLGFIKPAFFIFNRDEPADSLNTIADDKVKTKESLKICDNQDHFEDDQANKSGEMCNEEIGNKNNQEVKYCGNDNKISGEDQHSNFQTKLKNLEENMNLKKNELKKLKDKRKNLEKET